MAKLRLKGLEDMSDFKTYTKNVYMNKYYNIFMNNYKIPEVDYQANNFIFRKLWADGSLATFKMEGSEGSSKYPNGMPIFTPYAPSRWNIYDFPTYLNLINIRGVKFIPSKQMEVDKDAVIIYAQRNFKSVKSIVEWYVDRIVKIEAIINNCLNGHKTPWIIATTPESKMKSQELRDLLESDDPSLFLELEEANNAKLLLSGAPYIIDKLDAHKDKVENELREYLGINNLGVAEKKEHLVTDEIASNNEAIAQSKEVFTDVIRESLERANEVLGFNLTLEVKKLYIDMPDIDAEEADEDE